MSNSEESSAVAAASAARLGTEFRDGGGMLGYELRAGGGMLVREPRPSTDGGGRLGGAAPVVMIAIIFSA